MRVVTLNANGVRSAAVKGLVAWLAAQEADVVCLQEVRALEPEIPAAVAGLAGYRAAWHCAERRGYSGVGALSRLSPASVSCGLGHGAHDAEGRVLALDFGDLRVLSVYVPSGSSGSPRQDVKMDFLERLLDHLARLRADGRELLVCGDLNVAHRPVDLANWRANQKSSGFLPEEREWFDRLLAHGFVDVYRELVGPEAAHYSWWSSRGRARENNVGWRLDYHIATSGLAGRARAATIDRAASLSDHAPVVVDYDLASPALGPPSAV